MLVWLKWREPGEIARVWAARRGAIWVGLTSMQPEVIGTGPEDIALEAIREVGNDGHFFGIQHTQDRYSTAFYQPYLSDWRNYEAWEAAGAVWTPERAHNMRCSSPRPVRCATPRSLIR